MGIPIVIVASGGLAVTEAESGFGTPVSVSEDGFGLPVTLVDSGGLPVVGAVSAPSAFATGALSFNGNVVDGETDTIGATVYRYVTVLAQAYDVLIGATASITINNHIAAVNDSGGEGTVYGTGTSAHPDVTASSRPGIMDVTANVAGAAGNAIVTTSTSLTATWGAPTLQGGA